MKKKIIFILILCISLAAHGIKVDNVAGMLSTKIDNASAITSLEITGSVDASDFFFMEKSMPALTSLDLFGATIVEYNGPSLGGLTHYAASTIPQSVFAGSNLQYVSLAKGTSIGALAFAGSSIKDITLPQGVSVGSGAFSNCVEMTGVTLEPGVTLGISSFNGCTSLTSVTGSENLTVIPEKAFDDCKALCNFDFGKSLTVIGEGAFVSSGLEEADLSGCKSLSSIGAWAFASNADLKNAKLPDHSIQLGEGIFFECTSLTSVELPESLKVLPAFTFKDTPLKEEIVLPAEIDTIGDYAMMGVSHVSVLTLPASLSDIGEGAMEDMTALTEIDASALTSVPELEQNVWYGVDQSAVRLKVDPQLTADFEGADQWQDFKILGDTSTSSPGIGIDAVSISGAFHGYILMLTSTGSEIDKIHIYNTSGALLVAASGVGSQEVTIDTARFDVSIFVVECTLADGVRGVLKIHR